MEYEKRIFITPQEAGECLIVKDNQVHNFIQAGFGLVGADWDVQDVAELLDEATSIEIGGEQCRKLGHGLVAIKEGEAYFFEADNDKLNELEKKYSEPELLEKEV